MDNPFDYEKIKKIKEELLTNGPDAAAAKIQEYLKEQNNIPLNIAITGETGSGKSTFVNAFRGILDEEDQRAAPTGPVETTLEATPYPHPNYPNVTLWDLPGIGTTKFPADKYLKLVGFERFDFFIIISADRFRENDVKLAQEIQRMGRKFYFVRSKIDHNLRDEEDSQRDFNAERTLKQIRDNCIQGLQRQGVESPQVFLVSSFHLHLYDFPLLGDTFERELPAHKKHALLLATSNISLEVIDKKKKAFHAQIKYYAMLSAGVAAAPVPGLSVAVDLGLLVSVVIKYVNGFGLDKPSLQRLPDRRGMPFRYLINIIVSPLAATQITRDLGLKVLLRCAGTAALIAAEKGSRFTPVIRTTAAMSLSLIFTYRALNTFLNRLAEDAQRVFKRVLGLDIV